MRGKVEAGQRVGHVIAEFLVAGHFAGILALAILRHVRLESSIFDLGIFDQIIWNTANGRPFASSVEVRNALGEHFSPILAALAPLYWAWHTPIVLLVVQTAVVSLSGLAVYSLAARWTQSTWLALALLAGYLFHPSLIGMLLFDFHPDAILTALTVTAGWAIVRRHHVLTVLCVLLMLACKEDAGIALLGLGLLCLLAWRRRWTGVALVALGPTAVLVTGMWAVAHFREGPPATLDRYIRLGQTSGDIAGELARHPLKHLVGREDGLLRNPRRDAIRDVLLPSGGLVLCTPSAVALLPAILPHTLSGFPDQYRFVSQYGAIVVPLLTLVSIDGARRLRRFVLRRVRRMGWERWRPARDAVASVLAVLILLGCAFGYDKWYTRRVEPLWAANVKQRVAAFTQISQLIPPDAPLLCSNSVGAQLSRRRWLQCLRPGGSLAWFPRVDPDSDAPLPSYVLIDRDTCWRFAGQTAEEVDDTLYPLGFEFLAESGPFVLYQLPGTPSVTQ